MYSYESVRTKEEGKQLDLDLESGNNERLFPGISYGENQLRWGLIRKVYGILAAQLVLTTIVASATVLYTPLTDLLFGNSGFLFLFSILPLALIWPLHIYHQKHPVNLILLGLFTVSLSFLAGATCANTEGKIVLEALILTSGVVCSLTGYTFWASKRGKEFGFLGPILLTGLVVLLLSSFIQVFFPLGSTTSAVYGGLSALVFCGYIVYDTHLLIKRFSYDEYILASTALYLDILNLFLSILRVLREAQN